MDTKPRERFNGEVKHRQIALCAAAIFLAWIPASVTSATALLVDLRPVIELGGSWESPKSRDARERALLQLKEHFLATGEIVSLVLDSRKSTDELQSQRWPTIDEWEKDTRLTVFIGSELTASYRVGFSLEKKAEQAELASNLAQLPHQMRREGAARPDIALLKITNLTLDSLGSPLATLEFSEDSPPPSMAEKVAQKWGPQKSLSPEGPPTIAVVILIFFLTAVGSATVYFRLNPEIEMTSSEWRQLSPLELLKLRLAAKSEAPTHPTQTRSWGNYGA